MISIVFGPLVALAIVCVLIFPVGFASSRLIFRTKRSSSQALALAFGFGSCVNMCIWAWIYLLGGDISLVLPVTLILNGLSTIYLVLPSTLSLKRRSRERNRLSSSIVLIFLGLVASLFYILPRTYEGHITARQVMGPDSVGYANAVAGLIENGSFARLQAQALAAAGETHVSSLFSQDSRSVYRIVDKSLSLKTEFLIGAHRIGFTGIAAVVTHILGFQYLYAAMHVLVTTGLSLGALLVYGLLRSHQMSIPTALSVTILSMTNINLLVGYHEGGVAQAWMYFALASFLCGLLHDEQGRLERIGLVCTSFVFAITSYVDMLYVFLAICVLFGIIAWVRNDDQSIRRARDSAVALAIALACVAPMTLRLPGQFLRRLADARQGGWAWDSWPELASIVGLINPYLSPPDSIFAQVVLLGLGLVVVRSVVAIKKFDSRSSIDSFGISLLVFTGGFYLYSRYIMDHTNYQWFKLVGTIVGPSALVVISLLVERVRRDGEPSQVTRKILFGTVGVLCISSSLSYVRYFWGESLSLSHERVEEAIQPEVRRLSTEFVFIGRYDWQEFALTPFWSASFANREDQRIQPRVVDSMPVGLVIRETYCPNWTCLSGIPRTAIHEMTRSYRLVNLGIQSDTLNGLSPYMQWRRVNEAVVRLGSNGVDIRFESLSPVATQ